MTGAVRHAKPEDLPAVRALCRAYRDLLRERSTGVPAFVETYYGDAGFEDLLARLPEIHARPKGAILVWERAGRVLGCAMTHEIAPGLAEVKRIFVDPAARGMGAGRALSRAAIDQARADGNARLCLDTFATLTEAIALYRALGFAPCAPFYEPAPELAENLRFFDIRL